MENSTVTKYTISFGLSLALASVVNALLVVAKEKSPAIQAGMQRLTGHHWITHCAIVLVIFAAGGWLFANVKPRISAQRPTGVIVACVAASGLMIIGFYLLGD